MVAIPMHHEPPLREAHQEAVLDFRNDENTSDNTGWSDVINDNYYGGEEVGQGVYGKVYKARHAATNRVVAIKKPLFEDHDFGDGIPPSVIREVSLLQSLRHPNVVQLLDVHFTGPHDYYLVFEYIPTDLHRVLRDHRHANTVLPMDKVQQFARDLFNGLHACHIRFILHRDLKPQNLLIDGNQLKICDFGLARQFSVPLKSYTHEVVTLWYRAPEILLGAETYGAEVDMWSAGCVLHEMVLGHPRFCGDSEIHCLFKIFEAMGTPTGQTWPGVAQLPHWSQNFPQWPPKGSPEDFQDIREVRPDFGEAGLDLLRGLLYLWPQARITARRAKNHNCFMPDEPEAN